jgi:MFS family permease
VLRRNVLALITDSGSFGGALGFMGYSTVMPRMVLDLTASEPLVGLITTIWTGAWLLPQLFVGRWMANRPHKKPILLKSALIGRSGIALLAIALALNLDKSWLFILLAAALALFRGLDAVSAVAWFDIISKVLPPNVRGRVLGWTQTAAFLMQFGASFVVVWALSGAGPSFPVSYALLMGLAAVLLMVSFGALLFLIEPPGDVANNVSGRLNVGAHVQHIFKTDRAFRLNAIGRLLIGGIGLATPFYVVQATEVLNVPKDSVGLFLAAQTIGGVVSSLILGSISQRRGSHIVIRATMLLALIPPAMALLLNLFARQDVTLATIGSVVIFAAMGATDGSFLLGFLQHVLEIAPPAERTAYTGLANTIGGLTVIAPTIGGVLLQATSFPVLFIVTILFPIAGLVVAWMMPSVKHEE